MTLAAVEARYVVTIRNSGDEVVLSDDDVKQTIVSYLEESYDGVLFDVDVERKVDET